MASRQLWTALVSFVRGADALSLLPDWAEGASGWMVAFAVRADEAHALLVRDLERCGLRQIEVEQLQPVEMSDIVDEHLATNVRNLEPDKQTAWGTLHCWRGEDEA
jgi:hypothetical protein